MRLYKDDITYDIEDETQITAFLNSGWEEADHDQPDESPYKRRKIKEPDEPQGNE